MGTRHSTHPVKTHNVLDPVPARHIAIRVVPTNQTHSIRHIPAGTSDILVLGPGHELACHDIERRDLTRLR